MLIANEWVAADCKQYVDALLTVFPVEVENRRR